MKKGTTSNPYYCFDILLFFPDILKGKVILEKQTSLWRNPNIFRRSSVIRWCGGYLWLNPKAPQASRRQPRCVEAHCLCGGSGLATRWKATAPTWQTAPVQTQFCGPPPKYSRGGRRRSTTHEHWVHCVCKKGVKTSAHLLTNFFWIDLSHLS